MKIWIHQDVGPRDDQEDAVYAQKSGLAVICDGMGGHVAGELASRTAMEAFAEAVNSGDTLAEALDETVARLRSVCFEHPEVRDMGTTLTAVRVDEDKNTLEILHVGDCRVYRFRSSPDGHNAEQLTEDHGQGNALERYLPDEPEPDIFEIDVQAGDRLLLCTDGISDVLGEDELCEAMSSEEPAFAAVEMALETGTFDNASAVVLEVGTA